MSYIGNTSTTQTYAAAVDYFSGNGSTTAFTLSKPVAATPQVQVVVNNVPQNPTSAFTVSGNTITFTSAPSSGTNNIYVYYTSPVTQVIAPSAGTVQSSSIASGGPTWDANGNVSLYTNASLNAANTFGFKNRIINGAMMIDQRNAGASVAITTSEPYITDRFKGYASQASKLTAQQSTTAPTGFVNSLLATSLSAYSVGASEVFKISQVIEGLNIADLGWGTANAQTVTLTFQVRSSLTGTFGGALRNSADNYSYPFSYTINSANTFETKTITIAGPTSGTWLTTNGAGIKVMFGLGCGSTVSGTAGSWSANYYESATGATSVVGTNGATFYITGVQLEKGSVATPFDFRSYGTELALCQRYYQRYAGTAAYTPGLLNGFLRTATVFSGVFSFPVVMRSTPTGNSTNSAGAWYVATQNDLNGATIIFDALSPVAASFNITTNSGVAGQGGKVYPVATGTYFDLSAEL